MTMQFDFSTVDWSDDDSSPFDKCGESSSCATEPTEIMSSSSSLRTSRVTFAAQDQVFDHLHLKDISEEDINASWFRPHEFRQIKARVYQSVDRLEQQPPVEEETLRGLEHRTTQGRTQRSRNKRQAYGAVLQEQDRQWASGHRDADRLASAYLMISCHCLGLALLRAGQDEADVRDYVEDVRAFHAQSSSDEWTLVKSKKNRKKKKAATSSPVETRPSTSSIQLPSAAAATFSWTPRKPYETAAIQTPSIISFFDNDLLMSGDQLSAAA